jgi:ADP-heptose:LPS heptosyltransferase
MRILALVPGGIGDQILFFPTLDDLKRHYPQAEIDVIVEPRAKGAYRVAASVEDVLTFDFADRNGPADFGNLLGIVRDREYDAALALGQRWSTGLLLWMSGIPMRIGYRANAGKWFFSHTVPLKSEQYVAHMYHDLLQGLGITSPCPEVKLSVPKPDIEWAEAEQKRLGIEGSGYILISGDSGQLAQSYPVEKWQHIIEDIQQKQPDLPIVLLNVLEDEQFVAAMMQVSPDLNVTAPGDVGKLAAIVASASLMLCPDSDPLHVAVAVGTYTVALFGAAQASQQLPPEDERFVGIQSATGAIADINPEDVLKQVWRA